MNLVGQKIKHKAFGVGSVIAQNESTLVISFPCGEKKFQYTEANFEKFIVAESSELQKEILREFSDARKVREQELLEQKRIKQLEAEAAQTAVKATSTSKTMGSKKPFVQQERIPGKRMTFYVFQGNTFDRESKGGYIWAPITGKGDSTPHHWERLTTVHAGDIILHGCNGHVKAVSVARDQCYECVQPEELRTEDLWDQSGRRVDCEYILLEHPIKTSIYAEEIIRLCRAKYAPFDKDGNGNMGYLYDLNRELAQVFLNAAVKCNPSLGKVDYVAELLSEKLSEK